MSPLPPKILVYLTPGTGRPQIELSAFLSQESSPTITNTIENPTETNSFSAADVTLKGYDPTGIVQAKLGGITPTSTDFEIFINLGLWNPATSSYAYDALLEGYVAPSTLQFNPKEKSFSFTVIGKARNLQTTSAATLFLRPGYVNGKWYLYQEAIPLDLILRVTAGGGTNNSTCDFLAGDTIKLQDNETFTVMNVSPETTSSPPLYWELLLSEAPKKKYGMGVQVPVNLLTPYARNVSLHDVVKALFAAAGFPSEGYFGSAPLPNLSALFATPINTTGLPKGPVAGLSPGISGLTQAILAGTPSGIYQSAGPTSPFSLLVSYKLPPVDPTNSGTNYIYTGPKRTRTRLSGSRYAPDWTYKVYGYDWSQNGGTPNRYIYSVTFDKDVAGPPYAFTTQLTKETYTVGTDSWGGASVVWAGASSTTIDELPTLYDMLGIDVDPATGTVFFTDFDSSSVDGPATFNMSAYQPGVGISRNKATGINGATVAIAPGYIAVFQTDGILGNPPTAYVYSVVANGTMTPSSTVAVSPYVNGRSIKKNSGDNRYYMLISDPVSGVKLTSWPIDGTADSVLFPTPVTANYAVDLICVPTTSGPGTGRYPMIALIGGSPYYVANSSSGNLDYIDLTDLSVGDALQQLSVLNAGFFYTAGFGWVFRSRSAPMPGNTIGTNDQIDGDQGLLSLTTQNVFNRWVGYVRVENENNSAIFGEAGNIAFADSGQAITLKTRFVTSISFAAALATSLYNYLGQQKRWIELERLRDGRTYEVGRMFRAVVDGFLRTFQIIETGHPMNGVTVKVVGLEV